MARKKILLAGGSYINLKALSGNEALVNREVVLTTDTHELFAGVGDGDYVLLGNARIGIKSNLNTIDPIEGRFFFDYENGILYIATGTGWKRCGISLSPKSALSFDVSTGDLTVVTDNETIMINSNNALEVKNIDYGVF